MCQPKEEMNVLPLSPPTRNSTSGKIEAMDQQINALVYKLCESVEEVWTVVGQQK